MDLSEDQTDGTLSMMYDKHKIDIERGLSLHSKSLKCDLNNVKWIGILVLVVTGVVPGYMLLNKRTCIFETEISPNLNQSTCTSIKQVSLTQNVYLTVCKRNKYITLDIRKFINGNASIIGIPLNLLQWTTLKHYMSRIDIEHV